MASQTPSFAAMIFCICGGVGEVTLLAAIGGGIVAACRWCARKLRGC